MATTFAIFSILIGLNALRAPVFHAKWTWTLVPALLWVFPGLPIFMAAELAFN